ncbi:MAG: DegT/DnrJ/EryC1/StrS family aminotransferase [Eubacteriales bacterium]
MNKALKETLNHAWGTIGPRSVDGGTLIAQRLGVSHALLTYSVQAALEAVLRGLDVEGFEVILPAYCDRILADTVLMAGATPVFADIDYRTGCLSPMSAERHITARTRAVLCEALGQPDLTALAYAAGRERLVLYARDALPKTEECAAAVYGIGCGANHIGIAAVDDTAMFDRIYAAHNCGRPYTSGASESVVNTRIGGNLRVSEFPCAVLSETLAALDRDAAVCEKLLSNEWPCPRMRAVHLPTAGTLLLRCDGIRCETCREALVKRGYTIERPYTALHRLPVFGGHSDEEFENTVRAETGYFRIRI